MPLKLAAIVPHPPVLIPNIGKENLLLLEKTAKAFERLSERLAAEKIETVVIISSHGPIKKDVFGINLESDFEINFEKFGDFSDKMSLGGDLELAQSIREDLIEDDSVQAVGEKLLDHGCGVPLYPLLKNLKNIEVVPLYPNGSGLENHYNLGQKIARQIDKSRKKIALLSSGDLSHRLTKNAPGGYSPRGAKFDQKIIECLREKKIDEILKTEEGLIDEAKPCGLRAIALFLGIVGEGYEIQHLSYESPFGVGYLTMIIDILG